MKSKTIKKQTPSEFDEVSKRYGVKNPQAIKMKILWVHLQALISQVYEVEKPDSPSRKLLQQYQRDWKISEEVENKVISRAPILKKIFALALIVLAFGCSKKEDPAPTPEQLMSNPKNGWIITAATIAPGFDYNGTTITDLYTQFDACDKDENLIFNSNGKYLEENPVKCDPSEPAVSESGTWTLTSDKSIINFKPEGDTAYEGKINSLTTTSLTLSTDFDPGTGIKYKLTLTYEAK